MDLETLAIRYETLGEDEVRQSMDRITDSTRQMTLTQAKAIEINEAGRQAWERGSVAMQAHGFQVGRLRQDLGSLVGRLTGTSLAIDRVGSALGAMAIGNVAVIGVLAAIAAMAYGWEQLSLKLKGVTADQEKAIDAFEKAQKLKEAGGKTGEAETGLKAEVAKMQATLDNVKSVLAEAEANGTNKPAIASLRIEVANEQKALDARKALLDAASAERDKEMARESQQNATKHAEELASAIKHNEATKAQFAEALRLEKNYYAAAKELARSGNLAMADEFNKLGDILQEATKPKKEKRTTTRDLPGLTDFLAEQKAEVAAMQETHALQVKLEQDSTDSTAQKYAKIEALDQAYLIEIMSIYGAESKEYDAMLKEMEEHRKQHTDAIVAEGRRQTQLENAEADRQSTQDEQELKRRERVAESFAKSTADIIAETFKKGLAKGGNASSALQGFGDGLLKQLGGIFVRMGEKSVAASAPLAIIRAGLSNIFTAPEASLAGGLALIALGEALDAIGSGGGGGGSGGGPVQSTLAPITFGGSISAAGGNAAAASGQITPITPVNATIIGPNDPQAQRQLVQLLANAARRNL